MAAANYAQPAKGPISKQKAVLSVNSDFVIGQKNVATAGTELPLSATSVPLTKYVDIQAKAGNTGNVAIGKNPVTMTTGYVLEPGESVRIEIDNLNKVYVDAATNGDGVNFIGY